jgi:hypothetical protein
MLQRRALAVASPGDFASASKRWLSVSKSILTGS